ncbi:MAG TPA: histidine phosphatase family protein, partial [Thermoanaerobaculia bacterium]|nr:histidine phosphatase family protein [Thermoanaerobaculia bacterium]
ESEGNLAGTLQGSRLDLRLSGRGRRQAEALAIRLSEEPIDLVVASPMSRAKETAEIVAAPHGLGVAVDPDLVEFDWGTLTGLPFDEMMEKRVGELRRRWRAGETDLAAPGGESPKAAAARVSRALERIAARAPFSPVVVAHGRINRVLMTVLLGRDISRMDEVRQRNGCVSTFEWRLNEEGEARGLDDITHLPPDLCSTHIGGESLK